MSRTTGQAAAARAAKAKAKSTTTVSKAAGTAKSAARNTATKRPANTAAGKAVSKHPAKEAAASSVAEFLAALEHPLRREVEAVRALILGVSPEIREEIKWNAPSFFTTEHFATFNLRAPKEVRLILHLGAKVKAMKEPLQIADPDGLLKWLGKDRAMVTFASGQDVKVKAKPLAALLADWVRLV